jgi:hypothetical protein
VKAVGAAAFEGSVSALRRASSHWINHAWRPNIPRVETFIARVSSTISEDANVEQRERQLAAALERVRSQLPALDVDWRCSTGSVRLPEQRRIVSWAVLSPEAATSALTVSRSDSVTTLVVGDVFARGDAAQNVATAFGAGGAEGVAGLDGCFGAVVIDTRAGHVWLASDLLGRLALRLARRQDDWFISPHDVCLVAAGAAAIEFDPIALVSSAVVENSLQARSLLKGIIGLEGNDICRIDGSGELLRRRMPKLDFNARVDAKDQQGIRRLREEAVDRCVEAAKHLLENRPAVRASLTAGLDSRAALAILLGAGARSRLHTVTSGGDRSLDFRTAQRVARLAHVQHSRLTPTPATADAFIDHGRLWAFVMNGDTDAKRAARPLPRWTRGQSTGVEGTAGEVYRGYYYQYFGFTGSITNDPRQAARIMLSRRFRRYKGLPLASESLRIGFAERLQASFDEYAALSSTGSDLVDLFYLFERCAHWGARAFRGTWSHTINPFLVPSALRTAYRLPPPVGRTSAFHAIAIRRYFPEAYWVPINGGSLLALEGPGKVRYATRQSLVGFGYLKERLRRRFDRSALTTDHRLADVFADELYDAIHARLSVEGSIVESVFSKSGVAAVLQEHRARKNRLALLGYWVTQALFQELLQQVRPRNGTSQVA